MKTISRLKHCILILLFALSFISSPVHAQSGASAVLDSATLEAQLDYLVQRTRVYDNYRAIRDDLFLQLRKNVVDSLNSEKLEVLRLRSEISERDNQIETLNNELVRAKNERDAAIRTKDSFSLFGLEIQKGVYNTVMWIIVLALIAGVVLLFLLFKRSHVVTTATKKELDHIQEEFEEYRKSAREKYEKLVVSHHNEIMKLKRP